MANGCMVMRAANFKQHAGKIGHNESVAKWASAGYTEALATRNLLHPAILLFTDCYRLSNSFALCAFFEPGTYGGDVSELGVDRGASLRSPAPQQQGHSFRSPVEPAAASGVMPMATPLPTTSVAMSSDERTELRGCPHVRVALGLARKGKGGQSFGAELNLIDASIADLAAATGADPVAVASLKTIPHYRGPETCTRPESIFVDIMFAHNTSLSFHALTLLLLSSTSGALLQRMLSAQIEGDVRARLVACIAFSVRVDESIDVGAVLSSRC